MFNDTVKTIQKKTKNLATKTFIQPYNPSNDGANVYVDCLGISATNGYNSMGDYWTLSLLPLVDGLGAQAAGNYIQVEKEMIVTANPDIMVSGVTSPIRLHLQMPRRLSRPQQHT